MSEHLRRVAREIFTEALAASSIRAAVQRSLRVENGRLLAAGQVYALEDFPDIRIVAVGKAAATLFDAVRPLLPNVCGRAVVSAPAVPELLGECDLYFAGGHPLPNEDSLAAARAALELLQGTTHETLLLFLVSGGASSMFEAALASDISLTDLLELNRRLIGSGAPIAQVNCVRKHTSAVKGGRLLALAGPATCLSLLVSDVPAGQLDALGSGPTLPDSTTVEDCRRVVDSYLGGLSGLPPSYARLLARGLPETPKAGDPALARSQALPLLDNTHLLEAAAAAARSRGFAVVIDNRCDNWDYRDAAEYLLARLHALAAERRPLCLLAGGEVTVRLPERPGIGGRNQQWGLHCAERLHTLGRQATVLSAGSDGVDGVSPAAGCIVDESTFERASAAGLDPVRHSAGFDAYPVFHGLGDAVMTGPTGTNLRDLRVLLS